MTDSGEAERRATRRIGQVLGKYRVERVLGAGGMATVYLAVHRNGHKVAIKVLSPELGIDEDIRARFVREGYAANSIEHPGVVRVIDDDLTEDGSPFLVMEFLQGETLQARVTHWGGTLPPREVLALAHQLLDVLAVAHARGTIHRDVKPDNLFLTREGQLKVLDFGVARIVMPQSGSDPTRTGRTMGTPAYMAPEQAFGKTREIDARTDLWSVGATMFTLLSGKHVHEAENAAQLVVLAATARARALRSVVPGVPEEVASVVDRACAFERADRFADARSMQAAVADAYRKLFGGEVTAARVLGSPSGAPVGSEPTLDAQSAHAPAPVPSAPSARVSRVEPAPVIAPAGVAPPPRRPAARFAGVAGVAILAAAVGGALVLRRSPQSAPSATASSAAPGGPTAPGCTTSAACSEGSVCRSGTCVALESPDCTVVTRPEDVHDDATVWFGAMFAAKGAMAEMFDGSLRDMQLARLDFMEVTNGLPPAHPGAPPRPIGLLLCDDSSAPERAARHLAEDLKLPAIIGFSRSKEVSDLAASVFNPLHVVALASNTSAMLSAIAPPPGLPRMVWRTTVSSAMWVPVDAALVRDVLEPDVRAHGLPPGEPMRVAFLNVENTSGMSYADAVVTLLSFNGKSAADNGENFKQLVSHDGRPAAEAAAMVRELVAFRPHVVLDSTTNGEIAWPLEAAWPGGMRPRYVVSALEAQTGGGRRLPDGIAGRIFDVDPLATSSAGAKFDLRYAAVFDPKTSPTHASNGAPYDAFYALAYALVALGDTPATGPAIASALARLGHGTSIDVGPGAILEATSTLAQGGSIDLQGTTTSLDFDPGTGDPTVELSVSCARNGREGVVLTSSGVKWDRVARQVTGRLSCK
jgi:serine/threonine-protein kinase